MKVEQNMHQIMRDHANWIIDTFLWYVQEYPDKMEPTEIVKIFTKQFEKMLNEVAKDYKHNMEGDV